jgi:two-component system phosphate regulon response regulator OmpR
MKNSVRVLIVDDDRRLQVLLDEYLREFGFTVTSLTEGGGTIEAVRKRTPDIVILDIMLPDSDGLEILRELRRMSQVPVIMLTARGEETDRIVGLELGADDYLPKPFNPRELLARMKAVLRRKSDGARDVTIEAAAEVIRAGGLELNPSRQILIREGRSVELSATEYRILEALMARPDTILSREQLMAASRGRDLSAFERSIDMHISRVRSKLDSIADSERRIRTIWGTGYMFLSRL